MSGRLADALAALAAAREQEAAGIPPAGLFDPPPEALEQTIETVTEHAPRQWIDAALDAIQRAARTHDVLTVEDVDWPDDVPVYDDRARGGAMRRAARAGWLTSTRQYRPSYRPESHRRPLLVWSSNLHAVETKP